MFSLTKEQTQKASEFTKAHACDITYVGAIGGRITYSFTNTSLGLITRVSCACGAEEDLTNYDCF